MRPPTANNGGTDIVKALEVAPLGSAITFATDNLSVLCLAGAPIVRGTEAYRKLEHENMAGRPPPPARLGQAGPNSSGRSFKSAFVLDFAGPSAKANSSGGLG